MENEKNPGRTPAGLPKAALDWSPWIPREVEVDGIVWQALGKGVRFAVYTDGTEVLKIPLTASQLLDEWRSSDGVQGTLRGAEDWEQNTRAHIREVRDRLMSGRLPATLLASPMIQRNDWIFQKVLAPLESLFYSSDDTQTRDLIDGGIECIHAGIRYGMMCRFFALPVDFALNSFGHVVMMGLGQLTFDPVTAADWLKRKPWRTEASGLHMLPESAREYFLDRMDRVFTESSLAQEWGRDIDACSSGKQYPCLPREPGCRHPQEKPERQATRF